MAGRAPFDDFRELVGSIRPVDARAAGEVRTILARLGDADGSLGRVEEIVAWLAASGGRVPPQIVRPLVAVFAGTHGLALRGISARGPEATLRAVELCAAGGAAVNQACLAHDLGLKVLDLALDVPTADISREPALDERACAATIAFGMETIAGGIDLLCVGDIGVGGRTVAAAVCAALLGGDAAEWLPAGSDDLAARRTALVDEALSLHRPHLDDPLEVLRRLGGREIAAIAGAIIAARSERIPVILDGYAALAAAVVLQRLNPDAVSHCLLADAGADPGQRRAAARLGLQPLLDLRLGRSEGLGAALGAGTVKAAALCVSGMAAALGG